MRETVITFETVEPDETEMADRFDAIVSKGHPLLIGEIDGALDQRLHGEDVAALQAGDLPALAVAHQNAVDRLARGELDRSHELHRRSSRYTVSLA